MHEGVVDASVGDQPGLSEAVVGGIGDKLLPRSGGVQSAHLDGGVAGVLPVVRAVAWAGGVEAAGAVEAFVAEGTQRLQQSIARTRVGCSSMRTIDLATSTPMPSRTC
jgi:hypothetical protein